MEAQAMAEVGSAEAAAMGWVVETEGRATERVAVMAG